MRDPASFRDPDSTVFYADGELLRGLSPRGLEDWEALAATKLYPRLVEEGKLVPTERAEARDGYAAVLRHEPVPFVSYPYEWPFGMLRDAALLQLELTRRALDEGLILKDATPYNVQWHGTRPVFVDVGSFERLREGEPWVAYRQFCLQFLNPLLLQAYRRIDLQPLLRGRLEGVTPRECRRMLRFRDRFRRGVLTNVVLHDRLERRHAERQPDVGRELRRAGFHAGLIRANVERLERLVRRLRWEPGLSEWSEYGRTDTYDEPDAARKEAFVREAVGSATWRLAWDVGCNDGRFSRLAAEHAATVVALDADHAVVERLYRALRDEGDERILPLVVDAADPSPGLGWRGRERRPLFERGSPDLVLCLAVLHHLAITRNVPLRELVDWLASLEATLVLELPTPDDPMVRRMIAAKREGVHDDYRVEVFERLLGEALEVRRREELGSRVLYLVTPRT
jgi:ribosomal protein L11 methylase PrmA